MKKNYVKESREFLKSIEDGGNGYEVLENMSIDEIEGLFHKMHKRFPTRDDDRTVFTRELDLRKYAGVIGIRDSKGNMIKNGDILTSNEIPCIKDGSHYGIVIFEEDSEYNSYGFSVVYKLSSKAGDNTVEKCDGICLSDIEIDNDRCTDTFTIVGNITNANDVKKYLKGKPENYDLCVMF